MRSPRSCRSTPGSPLPRHCCSRPTAAAAGWNGPATPPGGRPASGCRGADGPRPPRSGRLLPPARCPLLRRPGRSPRSTLAAKGLARRGPPTIQGHSGSPRGHRSPTSSDSRDALECQLRPGRSRSRTFVAWKSQRRRITVLTAYDFPTARLLDAAGVDCLLVGDSLGTVVQGWETTLRVTLDQIDLPRRDGRAGRAACPGRGRPAVPELPGLAAAGAPLGRPDPQGDQLPGREARGGPQDRADHPGPGRGRDPRDGARRAPAAGDPTARRLQGPAPRPTRSSPTPTPWPRPGRSRIVLECIPSEPGRQDHRAVCRSRPSASAPARIATARCSSLHDMLGLHRAASAQVRPAICRARPRRSAPRPPRTSPTSPKADSPARSRASDSRLAAPGRRRLRS